MDEGIDMGLMDLVNLLLHKVVHLIRLDYQLMGDATFLLNTRLRLLDHSLRILHLSCVQGID